MIKIPGVPTGTVNVVTENGRRARWQPHGDLTLIVSETAKQALPPEIKGNPDAQTLKQMIRDRDKRMERSLLGRFLDWALRRGEFPPVKESARLFVGHNVENAEYWRSGQVYLMGYLLREQQLKKSKHGVPAFSFYVGLGAFPSDRGNNITAEESSQLVFTNFGQSREEFFGDMAELAQLMAENLDQESVLLELSDKGRVAVYEYVEAKRQDWVPLEDTEELLEENSHRVSEKVWKK